MANRTMRIDRSGERVGGERRVLERDVRSEGGPRVCDVRWGVSRARVAAASGESLS